MRRHSPSTRSVGSDPRRDALIRRATVRWTDANQYVELYDAARMISRITGISYSVDHIIPLCGTHVCGLHVGNNLQIISNHNNQLKGRRFEPGDEPPQPAQPVGPEQLLLPGLEPLDKTLITIPSWTEYLRRHHQKKRLANSEMSVACQQLDLLPQLASFDLSAPEIMSAR